MVKVLRCKVLILGGACVGKSALAQVFHSDGVSFPKNYSMTSGAEFVVKTIAVPDVDCVVELYIFDVGGQETFNELAKKVMPGTAAVILAYDITNPDSFREIPSWIERITPFLPPQQATKLMGALVACKADLENRAVVKKQEGEAFAKHHNLEFFTCSAKENKGVDAVFQAIARMFCTAYEEAVASFSQ